MKRLTATLLTLGASFMIAASPAAAAPYVHSWNDRVGDAAAPADIRSVRVTMNADVLTVLVPVRDLRASGVLTTWVTQERMGWKVQVVRSGTGVTLRTCGIDYYAGGITDTCENVLRAAPHSRVEWRGDHNYVRVTLHRLDFHARGGPTWDGQLGPALVPKVVMRASGAADGTLNPCTTC